MTGASIELKSNAGVRSGSVQTNQWFIHEYLLLKTMEFFLTKIKVLKLTLSDQCYAADSPPLCFTIRTCRTGGVSGWTGGLYRCENSRGGKSIEDQGEEL